MFAGHVGVGMAVARLEPRVSVGLFVAAALLLDGLLWLFVLLGWESVVIPSDFATTHQPAFVFPYSHGLVATVGWSLLAAAGAWAGLARLGPARRRAALLIAAAVASHWGLDALVHRVEMPLGAAASRLVGLGLWDHLPVALTVEAALALLGVGLFVRGGSLSRGRSLAFTAVSVAVLASTVAGMTVAPAPPSAQAMATSSLAVIVVLCALTAWLGRPAAREAPASDAGSVPQR